MARQSLSQATSRANQQANLNNINNFGSAKSNFEIESTLSVVEQVAGEFIKRVQENLRNSDSIVTGAIDDISIVIPDENSLQITAAEHLIYQDKGVNGSVIQKYNTPYKYSDKKPPIQPFIDWAKRRGIEDASAPYAIREKVFQEGIAPKDVYSKEIPKLIDDLKNSIASFVLTSITEVFKK